MLSVDDNLPLPWWEFGPDVLSQEESAAQQSELDRVEDLLPGFFQAGARWEVAEKFISANSLYIAEVLDLLSRDELVIPPHDHEEDLWLPRRGVRPLICRSKLLGLSLAHRHAALNMACTQRHRLPRRALVNFLCRLVLGKEVTRLQYEAHGGVGTLCVCGARAQAEVAGVGAGLAREKHPTSPATDAITLGIACRSCVARRRWLDSFSVRMLTVACHKMLWDTTLLQDEELALNRCLSALEDILGATPPCHASEPTLYQEGGEKPSSANSSSSTVPSTSIGGERAPPASVNRGVSALLDNVRRKQIESREGGGLPFGCDARPASQQSPKSLDKRRRGADVVCSAAESASPAKRAAIGSSPTRPGPYVNFKRTTAKDRLVARADEDQVKKKMPARSNGGVADGETLVMGQSSSKPSSVNDDARPPVTTEGKDALIPNGDAGDKEQDCLPLEVRDRLPSIVEKVAAAGARGATSADIQGAASAAVSILQTVVSSNIPTARLTLANRAQQQHPLTSEEPMEPIEAVCQGIGLASPKDKDKAGCGDDLIMAICNGFVTPALSLRNCLTFVKAMLVPRVEALSTPASRMLVTAVSGVGKARPGAIIDGLILPVMCGQDEQQSRGRAPQYELCTRLIKQVLPKHTLEAVIVGLSRSGGDANGGTDGRGAESIDSGSGSGSIMKHGSCTWTNLTTPVITAALNLKPPLSDDAIAVVVQKVDASSEAAELQKCLKFSTLVHALVTRYGPQLKPFVPVLRGAIGRCSTFMVKAVLAALQRLDK